MIFKGERVEMNECADGMAFANGDGTLKELSSQIGVNSSKFPCNPFMLCNTYQGYEDTTTHNVDVVLQTQVTRVPTLQEQNVPVQNTDLQDNQMFDTANQQIDINSVRASYTSDTPNSRQHRGHRRQPSNTSIASNLSSLSNNSNLCTDDFDDILVFNHELNINHAESGSTSNSKPSKQLPVQNQARAPYRQHRGHRRQPSNTSIVSDISNNSNYSENFQTANGYLYPDDLDDILNIISNELNINHAENGIASNQNFPTTDNYPFTDDLNDILLSNELNINHAESGVTSNNNHIRASYMKHRRGPSNTSVLSDMSSEHSTTSGYPTTDEEYLDGIFSIPRCYSEQVDQNGLKNSYIPSSLEGNETPRYRSISQRNSFAFDDDWILENVLAANGFCQKNPMNTSSTNESPDIRQTTPINISPTNGNPHNGFEFRLVNPKLGCTSRVKNNVSFDTSIKKEIKDTTNESEKEQDLATNVQTFKRKIVEKFQGTKQKISDKLSKHYDVLDEPPCKSEGTTDIVESVGTERKHRENERNYRNRLKAKRLELQSVIKFPENKKVTIFNVMDAAIDTIRNLKKVNNELSSKLNEPDFPDDQRMDGDEVSCYDQLLQFKSE